VKAQKRSPAPPFTTSTLQQEASRRLGFSPKRTMSVAQRLYEGVETPDGQVGLITYMRTDSVHLAGQAIGQAREVIAERFGPEYTMLHGRQYKTKQRTAQEAHEAVRPTSFARDPEELARHIGHDEARLYRLIWQRAIASQMREKELETTTVDLAAGRHGLRATATRTTFDGFARVYTEGRDDGADEPERTLPPLAQGDETEVAEVRPLQHFTEPPSRYTEATLVRALEENGVGRPSTYAAILSTIVERGYVVIRERRLHPEDVAEIVVDLLVQNVGEYVDPAFTARMESSLDDIARGERGWVPLVRDFYGRLKTSVGAWPPGRPTWPTDEVCSQGHPMVIRFGRNGRFLACSLYPEHRESRPLPGDEPDLPPDLPGLGEPCPECGSTDGGTLSAKRGRFGPFVGCDRYPACTYIRRDGPPPPPPLPFEAACPRCAKGHLVARRARRSGQAFWGCSRYPKCDYTTEREPLGPVHEPDGGVLARKDEAAAICLGCGATVALAADEDLSPGRRIAGGAPDPQALASPTRRRRTPGAGRGGGRRGAGMVGGPASTRKTTRRAAGAVDGS
ncbi:MAG: DNA topoisomerase, partial [Chloroflexi bacterium]|nr:DNA topoisomerase [Chloroflexota bacterium]